MARREYPGVYPYPAAGGPHPVSDPVHRQQWAPAPEARVHQPERGRPGRWLGCSAGCDDAGPVLAATGDQQQVDGAGRDGGDGRADEHHQFHMKLYKLSAMEHLIDLIGGRRNPPGAYLQIYAAKASHRSG